MARKNKKKIRSESVGNLVQYLLGNPFTFIPERYLSRGRWIHNRLGYNNMTMLQRKYRGVLIRGMPDIIEDDCIVELKTFVPRTKDYQMKRAAIQANLYCWLGGYEFYRVDLFNTRIDKLTIGKPQKARPRAAEYQIDKALRIKADLESVLSKR